MAYAGVPSDDDDDEDWNSRRNNKKKDKNGGKKNRGNHIGIYALNGHSNNINIFLGTPKKNLDQEPVEPVNVDIEGKLVPYIRFRFFYKYVL